MRRKLIVVMILMLSGGFFSGCGNLKEKVIGWAANAGADAAEKKLKEKEQEQLAIIDEQLKKTPKGTIKDSVTGEEKVLFYTLKDFDEDSNGEYSLMEVGKAQLAIQADRLKKFAIAKATGDEEAAEEATNDMATAGKAAGMLGVVMAALYAIKKFREKQKKKNPPPGEPAAVAAAPPSGPGSP